MLPKETYYYITGQRISKKVWNSFIKRFGMSGDKIVDGQTTIAYRRVREETDAERVYREGRY